MTDHCLTMLETRGDIILEGRLASNDAFASALAALANRNPFFVLAMKRGRFVEPRRYRCSRAEEARHPPS